MSLRLFAFALGLVGLWILGPVSITDILHAPAELAAPFVMLDDALRAIVS